jgi:hypothetical protein
VIMLSPSTDPVETEKNKHLTLPLCKTNFSECEIQDSQFCWWRFKSTSILHHTNWHITYQKNYTSLKAWIFPNRIHKNIKILYTILSNTTPYCPKYKTRDSSHLTTWKTASLDTGVITLMNLD